MSAVKTAFENGVEHTILEFVILVENNFSDFPSFPEELVVRAHKNQYNKDGLIVGWTPVDFIYPMDRARSKQAGKNTCGYFQILIPWGNDFNEFSIGYQRIGNPKSYVEIVGRIRGDFTKISYVKSSEATTNGTDVAIVTPLYGRGKWHVAKEFLSISQFPSIYLWRCEIPAHFEMHSHVQSNHCSPFPPAWVHVWEEPGFFTGIANFLKLKPGYWWQDAISPIALGEGGKIGAMHTDAIGSRFGKDLSEAQMGNVFPFLKDQPDHIGCLMPMDLEYMHFNGYFGIPISKVCDSVRSDTGKTESVRWFCWDKSWGFSTNNVGYLTSDGVEVPPKYVQAPASPKGEIWSWMEPKDKKSYEPWLKQRRYHVPLATPGANQNTQLLPFYHFDPRRYTSQASSSEDGKWNLAKVLNQPIQAQATDKPAFFGFKLYTAMGWAPMDPYLRDPLETFYGHCELKQIPLLNHGTPAGYYTHDRRHYFDLLHADGKVIPGADDEQSMGWLSRFSHQVPGPDGAPLIPNLTRQEHWWAQREEERLWWYTHHYVSPQAWKPIIERFPNLKLCLAHFGDSDHLKDNNWSSREAREPRKTRRDLQIAFAGSEIDPTRTHRFLLDLLNLIQPTNRVFVDLSYVILTEENATRFHKLFDWAREYKPILLERILWGTDWPLIAKQNPVTSATGGNMLHRYAKGFRSAIPSMPGDFFIRACFLNPLQYMNMKGIRTLFSSQTGAPDWSWIDDMDSDHFNAAFNGDKAELFYRHHKGWTS